ncbi:MAG: hypothetical protein WBM12_21040, partial [Pseudolabrys sp.]
GSNPPQIDKLPHAGQRGAKAFGDREVSVPDEILDGRRSRWLEASASALFRSINASATALSV